MLETYRIIVKELVLWLDIWEAGKANGEDGLPGSPNIQGAVKGLAIILAILRNTGKKDTIKALGLDNPIVDDAGCGVNCFLKIIRILLNCACAGFEYKKMLGMFMKEYRHDGKVIQVPMIMSVLRAIREIDEKVSLYHENKITNAPFALKFNAGWEGKESANGNIIKSYYKKWLTRECGFKKGVAKRNGRIEVMFCEGWVENDLESLLKAYGDFKTSGVGIIFVANNPNKVVEENGKEKCNLL